MEGGLARYGLMHRFFSHHITELPDNTIIVFGSNLAGIHGAGAARQAHQQFGAEWGVGEGPTGRCYALPTKDEKIHTLPLDKIQGHVLWFIGYAAEHPELEFLVTPIGCGLAGYSPKQIGPMFGLAPENCILHTDLKVYADQTLLNFVDVVMNNEQDPNV